MLFETTINKKIDILVSSIDAVNEKKGLLVTSAIIALSFLILAMIYVRPSLPFFPDNLVGVTEQYYQIALDPFGYDWEGAPRGFRIGVPLLSWTLGLRGESLAYTTIGILYVFIFAVFYRYVRQSGSTLVGLSITSVIVFTAPILYNLFDLASVEAVRVFLMILMIWTVRNRVLFWALFLVNIFVHEGAAVFMPFYLILRWPLRKSFIEFIIGDLFVGVALTGAYLPFYDDTGSSTYLDPWKTGFEGFLSATRENLIKWVWHGYEGIFSAFRLYWIVVLTAFVLAVRDRRWYDGLLIVAPIMGFGAMMIVSWETTRMALLAAPTLVISFDQLRIRFGDEVIARSVLMLGVINLFVPQQLSLGGPPGAMPSLPHMLMFWLF